jgi:large subunit ribosomal protein L10
MPTQKKIDVVASLKERLKTANSVIVALNSGMQVHEFEDLRNQARERGGINIAVYPNTLAKIAIKDTAFACLNESLSGQTVLLISEGEIGALAKLTHEFLKKNEEKFGFNGLAEREEGVFHGKTSLSEFANLPTREEALTQLVVVMKAPITKFVRTTREPIAKLTRAFAAIAAKGSE